MINLLLANINNILMKNIFCKTEISSERGVALFYIFASLFN